MHLCPDEIFAVFTLLQHLPGVRALVAFVCGSRCREHA